MWSSRGRDSGGWLCSGTTCHGSWQWGVFASGVRRRSRCGPNTRFGDLFRLAGCIHSASHVGGISCGNWRIRSIRSRSCNCGGCPRMHRPIGGDLGSTSRADLLHDQPRSQAIDVEDVVARQLLRLGAIEQRLPANDAVLVVLDLFVCRIWESHVHIHRNAAIPSERAQALRQLTCHLDDVRHHVDRQPRWVLHEEGQHEDQEKRH
mmetsp:Transcript_11789/g.33958  ORF Transcript_11789/g.33958 Transcript_11789/m.33958 type:complete len:206 (+) Transcript_11789:718-1335(+)